MKLRAFAGTDVGLMRDHNEDSYYLETTLGVFAVFDGVGGHNAGEVASRMAAQTVARQTRRLQALLDRYRKQPDEASRAHVIRKLPQVFEQANEQIHNAAQRDQTKRGMATTAILMLTMEEDAFVCHVGDSRLYLFREGSLFQVTEDHSLVMQLFKRGLLRADQLASHPRKNVILRSLGAQPTVEVDILLIDVLPDDVFLLCSDGLSDMVPQEEIAALLGSAHGDELIRRLIDAAKRHGGRDNITVMIVEVGDEADLDADPERTRLTQRLNMVQKVEFLQDVFLFSKLNDQECLKVNRILHERAYAAGQAVVHEGGQGDELYLVVSGRLGVWRGEVRLTTLVPGSHFGELSLIGDTLRSATVRADEPCTLWVIQRSDFLELCNGEPALGHKMLWAFLQNLGDRVRDLTVRLAGC